MDHRQLRMDTHDDTSMDNIDIPSKNHSNHHTKSSHPNTRDHIHHNDNDIIRDIHKRYIH
jgi:hypothetical protein